VGDPFGQGKPGKEKEDTNSGKGEGGLRPRTRGNISGKKTIKQSHWSGSEKKKILSKGRRLYGSIEKVDWDHRNGLSSNVT